MSNTPGTPPDALLWFLKVLVDYYTRVDGAITEDVAVFWLTRAFPRRLRDALLLRTRHEDMLALLHTNLLGCMLTCRAALRSMLHTQGAAIVNIGTELYADSLATRWQ